MPSNVLLIPNCLIRELKHFLYYTVFIWRWSLLSECVAPVGRLWTILTRCVIRWISTQWAPRSTATATRRLSRLLPTMSWWSVTVCSTTNLAHISTAMPSRCTRRYRSFPPWIFSSSSRVFSCLSVVMDYSLPRLCTKFGERAFSHAGPATWNALPDHIRTVADPVKFRKLLTSHYFSLAFNTCWFLYFPSVLAFGWLL